jgi:DNA (cytosine-5)-methyltransferase 1
MGDIVEFTSKVENIESLPYFDLLTGGFPCQTFSMMGKQAGFNEDRGQMFFRIMDIVKIKRPRYVLLENVKNLFTHDKGNTFARIRKELEHEGYNVMANIFNTADYHLPQKRNRVLIFATREKLPKGFEFTPEAVKKCFDEHIEKSSLLHYKSVVELLAKEVESKYYLSEKIKPTILSDGSGGFQSKSDINQSIARPLTASMHKMHRACQDNYYSQNYIDTNGEVNPVETMTKEELAKLKIRKLTPAEAFMLQGFPSEFAIKASFSKVSDGALYKQAGNAVSVNTIYAVVYYLIKSKIIK